MMGFYFYDNRTEDFELTMVNKKVYKITKNSKTIMRIIDNRWRLNTIVS